MNYQIFEKSLKDNMGLPNNKPIDKIVDAVANAYELSCVNHCSTTFQSKLLSGDKNTLKKCIESALKNSSKFTKPSSVGWQTMANGFVYYWKSARFTPIPPMPPCTTPNPSSANPGANVMFPGSPTRLKKGLEFAWTRTVFKDFVDYLYDALLEFHLTITGNYNGIAPTPLGPAPLVVPWFSIIGGSRRRSLTNNSNSLLKPVPQGRGTYIRAVQLWERKARRIPDHEENAGILSPEYIRILYSNRGDGSSVSTPEVEINLIKKNLNGIIIHNHPWDDVKEYGSVYRGSFSAADIINAIDRNVAETRVVNIAYTFVLQRPVGGWSSFRGGITSKRKPDGTFNSEDTGIFKDFENNLRNEFQEYTYSNFENKYELRFFALKRLLSPQEKQDIFEECLHNTNIFLANKYGWKYERIPVGQLKNRGEINQLEGYYGP
jgi:hypothetical protein